MRRFVFASLLCFYSITPSYAQEVKPAPVSPGARRVQLIEDQKLGAVRIVIDGKEVARIDASGLHVRGNTEYGGYDMDYGPGGLDRYIAEGRDAK